MIFKCAVCGDIFTEDDLAECREMGEAYCREDNFFLCPDCWDTFRGIDLGEAGEIAITERWERVKREPSPNDTRMTQLWKGR